MQVYTYIYLITVAVYTLLIYMIITDVKREPITVRSIAIMSTIGMIPFVNTFVILFLFLREFLKQDFWGKEI